MHAIEPLLLSHQHSDVQTVETLLHLFLTEDAPNSHTADTSVVYLTELEFCYFFLSEDPRLLITLNSN